MGIALWARHEVNKMAALPSPPELFDWLDWAFPWLIGFGVARTVGFIGFIVCLVRWLLLIRRRRASLGVDTR